MIKHLVKKIVWLPGACRRDLAAGNYREENEIGGEMISQAELIHSFLLFLFSPPPIFYPLNSMWSPVHHVQKSYKSIVNAARE